MTNDDGFIRIGSTPDPASAVAVLQKWRNEAAEFKLCPESVGLVASDVPGVWAVEVPESLFDMSLDTVW